MNPRVKTVLALGMLAAFGLLRWPLESAVTRDWKERHILAPELGLSLREKIGQNSYAAALGGARSFVASIENLRAFIAWENQDWGLVEQRYRLVQELQPRVPSYWEMGAWHMAYNASGWYQYDWEGPRGENSPEALESVRAEFRARYIRKGMEMFADGIRNNPENWKLCELAGFLAGDPLKLPDHREAARYYAMAAALPDAPPRVRRFEAYELSYLPDRRAEAMEKLAALYREGGQHRVPTLVATLFDLQLAAGVPEPDRIPLAGFGSSEAEIYQQLRSYAEYRRARKHDASPEFLVFLAAMEAALGVPDAERLPPPVEKLSQ